MSYKTILSNVPSLQALGLLGRNISFAKKGKGAIKAGITSLVGIPLISKTADLIKSL